MESLIIGCAGDMELHLQVGYEPRFIDDDEKAVKWTLTTNSIRTRTNSVLFEFVSVRSSSLFFPYFFTPKA
ncbi:MAG TPA: hypothetical protein VIO58_05555 [Candidatus Methanoperedens sp.]